MSSGFAGGIHRSGCINLVLDQLGVGCIEHMSLGFVAVGLRDFTAAFAVVQTYHRWQSTWV